MEPIPAGTMSGVINPEVIKEYVDGLNSKVGPKVAFILINLPQQENPVLVEVGCMTGEVAAAIKNSRPDWEVIGLDVNQEYIDLAKAAHPGIRFEVADIQEMPFEDGSVSAISAISVLHEVYTQNGFNKESVVKTLRKMYFYLREGGRVINREPAKPSNPDELVIVSLSLDNGINPPDEELLNIEPSRLSQFSLMKRFLLQFSPLKEDPLMLSRVEKLADGEYRMPIWIVSEYLRKRTFSNTSEHWNAEMKESNAPFTIEEMRDIALKAGFKKIQAQAVYENNYYAEIKEGDGITITDIDGKPIVQKERLPSHLYVILEK